MNRSRFNESHVVRLNGERRHGYSISLGAFWDIVARKRHHKTRVFRMLIPVTCQSLVHVQETSRTEVWAWERYARGGFTRLQRTRVLPFDGDARPVLFVPGTRLKLDVEVLRHHVVMGTCRAVNDRAAWVVSFRVKGPLPLKVPRGVLPASRPGRLAQCESQGRMTTCTKCSKEVVPEPGSGGTGYGVTKTGEKVCYACCADIDRSEMIASGIAFMYLCGDEKTGWTISNWPGSLLFSAKVKVHPRKRVFSTYTRRHAARFIGPDGFWWSGVSHMSNGNHIIVRRRSQRA